MGIRVWGVVRDRLVELVPGRADRFQILGLPDRSSRTTTDRIRAALINGELLPEAPDVAVVLDPPIRRGPTCDLDAAIAIAALIGAGSIECAGLGWVLAVGRVGPDGTIRVAGLPEAVSLAVAARRVSDP